MGFLHLQAHKAESRAIREKMNSILQNTLNRYICSIPIFFLFTLSLNVGLQTGLVERESWLLPCICKTKQKKSPKQTNKQLYKQLCRDICMSELIFWPPFFRDIRNGWPSWPWQFFYRYAAGIYQPVRLPLLLTRSSYSGQLGWWRRIAGNRCKPVLIWLCASQIRRVCGGKVLAGAKLLSLKLLD